MGKLKPQPGVLTIWRILSALFICVPAFLNSVLFRPGGRIWLWGTVLWILLFLLTYLIYLPLRYHRLSYSVLEDRVIHYGGVFYHSVRSLPIDGIQYTYVTESPLDRLFGLSSLVLVAAGGRVILTGLRRKDADALADVLGDRR